MNFSLKPLNRRWRLNDCANGIMLLYWMFLLTYFIIGFNSMIYKYGRLLINMAALALWLRGQVRNRWNVYSKEVLFFNCYFISAFMSSLHNGTASIEGHIYVFLSSIGITALMMNFKIKRSTAYVPYIYLCLSYIFYLSRFHWDLERYSNNFFSEQAGTSRNYISVFILIFTMLIYMAEREHKSRRAYIVTAVSFLISVLAVGRGGILTCGLLLLGSVYVWIKEAAGFREGFSRWMKAAVVCCMALGTVIELKLSDFFLGGFAVWGIRGERQNTIWPLYFSRLDNLPDILFGHNFLQWVGKWGHLHNSYLMLHVRFGLIMTAIITVMMLRASHAFWKNDSKFLSISILAFMARGMTDPILGFSYCDAFTFYFIFEGMRLSHNRAQGRTEIWKKRREQTKIYQSAL